MGPLNLVLAWEDIIYNNPFSVGYNSKTFKNIDHKWSKGGYFQIEAVTGHLTHTMIIKSTVPCNHVP